MPGQTRAAALQIAARLLDHALGLVAVASAGRVQRKAFPSEDYRQRTRRPQQRVGRDAVPKLVPKLVDWVGPDGTERG
jgi:hypothetical protein